LPAPKNIAATGGTEENPSVKTIPSTYIPPSPNPFLRVKANGQFVRIYSGLFKNVSVPRRQLTGAVLVGGPLKYRLELLGGGTTLAVLSDLWEWQAKPLQAQIENLISKPA
jgi:hypothetical protein